MKRSDSSKIVTIVILASIFAFRLSAEDWSNWRGPNYNGSSNETGLLDVWPANGPVEVFRKKVGDGFSTVAVADGRLFISYADNREEALFCFNAANGEQIWRVRLDDYFSEQYGDGPRSAPVVDGNIVYAMSSLGKMSALAIADGALKWQVDAYEAYKDPGKGIRQIDRGFASSPLVEGDLIIFHGGRARGKNVIALDKHTGKEVWTALSGEPSYSSPVAATLLGERQIISFIGEGLYGLSVKDGRELWHHGWDTRYDLNIATPIVFPDNTIFISSGYSTGAGMIEVTDSGTRVLWENSKFRNHFNSAVVHNGYLYGFDNNQLKCVSFQDGTEQWSQRGYGKGSLILADSRLYILSEKGELAMVQASPAGFNELGRKKVLSSKSWSGPVLANGRIYVRNHEELVCLLVK